MNSLQTNYQALVSDEIEGPHESVIFHVASEDSNGGYACIMLYYSIGGLMYFIIGSSFIYGINCIHFNFDQPPSPYHNTTVTSLSQLFIPVSQCVAENFGVIDWFLVILFILGLVYRVYKCIDRNCKAREIRQFFELNMKIPKCNNMKPLLYVTNGTQVSWSTVAQRLNGRVNNLRSVQHEQQMCVNNTDLNELDISHRILRTTNYMVAMVNKSILPLKLNIWFLGDWVYLSSQLRQTLVFLLFTSSFMSPFKAPGKLKEEFKKREERLNCANQLGNMILLAGVVSLALVPIIFSWSVLSFLLDYSGYMRLEPGFLTVRRWSEYAKIYLRHFNELDHELKKRLGRAAKPSKEYMRSFSTPLVVLMAKFSLKVLGSVVAFFCFWGIFKEQLFTLPYVLVIISVGAALFTGLSACVPDENEVSCPNELMQKVVAEIHYIPDNFKTMAHTTKVRNEFSHLFPYTIVILLEELLSPLVTPYILICRLRPQALEIVDFLRNFTVHVDGVGDVCSFALMDVSRHGNPQWLGQGLSKADQVQQAEDGKTELSALHFALMNPYWEPPAATGAFIQNFKEQVTIARDRCPGLDSNPYYNSLNSVSTMGSKYASLVNSIHRSTHQSYPGPSTSFSSDLQRSRVLTKLSEAEGPPYYPQNGIWTSMTGNEMEGSLVQTGLNPIEARAADMSLSALFLHEVHDKHMGSLRSQSESRSQSGSQRRDNGEEESPLLELKIGESYVP
ncbi:autophagy-related protein 9A [Trichonephila inaurata madagascariensis]|uniref:Autophagy-related protein 9 n=1 Tax=Trichonephila inaurata madagascariensis TaxID=2747483 RepID=A0A8X7CIY4_9ARAC|nr:autophagy-related protein 9A [Trichonephila inaurata madagascariensis]